jgi:hypothetical protein
VATSGGECNTSRTTPGGLGGSGEEDEGETGDEVERRVKGTGTRVCIIQGKVGLGSIAK